MSIQVNSLSLDLTHSKLHWQWIVGLHTACSALIIFFASEVLWKIAILLGIALSLRRELGKWQAFGKYRRLVFSGPDIKLYQRNVNEPLLVTLAAAQWVTAYCLVLNLRTADGRIHPLPLFNDACDAESLRKLRVLLATLAQQRVARSSWLGKVFTGVQRKLQKHIGAG